MLDVSALCMEYPHPMEGEDTLCYLLSSMTPLIALYIVGRAVVGLCTYVVVGLLPGMFKYMT